MKRKIIIQLNEANFDLIKKYNEKYSLSNIKKILSFPLKIKTTSEHDYNKLEPWIQWYSFYSNLDYDSHKVLHLGDCIKNDHHLFLDDFKEKRIGIFGSMNLRPSENYNIYIPDAWTDSDSDESRSSKLVSEAIKRLVNKNNELKVDLKSVIGLFLLIGIPKCKNDLVMIFIAIKSFFLKKRSLLVGAFDYFFFNYTLKRSNRNKLDLTMIFLNGLAHIQHHYLLNSEFVDGRNPDWYCKKESDPIYEILIIYDKMFSCLFDRSKDEFETLVVTGLTQSPAKKPIFYWRFKNHKKLLKKFFDFEFEVLPRMTRDFEIKCYEEKNMRTVQDFLENASIINGTQYFKAFGLTDASHDNHIFSSFTYDGEFQDVYLEWNSKSLNINNQLVFVAIKNGIHSSHGWAYSNQNNETKTSSMPIWDLSRIIT